MGADVDFFCPRDMVNVYPVGATVAQTFALTNNSRIAVASSSLSAVAIGPGSIVAFSSQSSVYYTIADIDPTGVNVTLSGPYTGPYHPQAAFPIPSPQAPTYPGTPPNGYTGTTAAAATVTVSNGCDLTAIFRNQPFARRIYVGGSGTLVVRTADKGRLCSLVGFPTGAHLDGQYSAIDSSNQATSLAVGS